MFHRKVVMVIPNLWFNFGVQVGITIQKLQDIEQKHNKDQEKCFLIILDLWEKNPPLNEVPFTWKSVLKVLKDLDQAKLCDSIAAELN